MKQLQRLIFAKQSMEVASAGCELALRSTLSEYERLTMAAGAVMIYGSPFTAANELGALEEAFSRFDDPVLAAIHSEVLFFRNKLYGHRDLSAVATRISDGLVANAHFIQIKINSDGTARVESSVIQWSEEAFERMKFLCKFQSQRLLKKTEKLMKQLGRKVKKSPGIYQLGIDFP